MKKTIKDLREKFRNPPAEVRGIPFWAWNGSLEPEEIREQIREFHSQGMGGFFMHSREGLETEYLGEKWFACVDAAVDEAKKLGMQAWIYDEDRWPSGHAGGSVPAGGDAYRLKGLTLQVSKEAGEQIWQEKGMAALFAAIVKGDRLFRLKRLTQEETAESGTHFLFEDRQENSGQPEEIPLDAEEVYLVFRISVSAGSQWFNGETPPDNLNPDTVKRFLELTHEKYFARFGGEFGGTIPGVFTDEPSLADFHASFGVDKSWIPWTYGLRDYFQAKKGYDPMELLPYFYFEGKDSEKIRHDYWHVITLRYSETYAGTISQWCRKHHLAMTGHFLQEDKLGLSTRVSGAVMPLYEYEDIPGIDLLQEKTDEYITVKQCASVAHQMGRRTVLSETYGVTGWDFTFEGQRRIGDWQYALGVNRRCQHLAYYSLAGCRKRDCPPGFGYNISWWDKAHIVEDYFARLGAALEEGEPGQQILVLHPASTAWSLMGASPYGNPVRRMERDVPKVNEIGNALNSLIETLCRHHLDPDLGDEILLSKYGGIEGGKLRVGKMRYSVVVLPPVRTMLFDTWKLLMDFAEQGGRLVVMEACATKIEGQDSELPEQLFSSPNCTLVKNVEELLRELENAGVRTIRIQNAEGAEENKCIALQKYLPEGELLFVVNCDMEESCQVKITVPGKGFVEEWNPLDGRMCKKESRTFQAENSLLTSFSATLAGQDSRLFYVGGENQKDGTVPDVSAYAANEVEEAATQNQSDNRIIWEFPSETEITVKTDNTLTLDTCTYKLDEEWSEPMQVWEAQEQIRRKLGMISIAANGIEQRYRWIHRPHPKDGSEISLKFIFEAADTCVRKLRLAIERPEQFEIYLNGVRAGGQVCGYLFDRDIKCVELPDLAVGKNTLLLKTGYTNASELENCYLCGDFGVDTDRRITASPRKLAVGSWTGQGLFHYAGSVVYHYVFPWDDTGLSSSERRIFLRPGDYRATCLTVYINDISYEMPWRALGMVDITEQLRPGNNRIDIELQSSMRNLFGPFHLKGGKPAVTNDAVFRTTGDLFEPAYQVEPYGLFEAPVLTEQFSKKKTPAKLHENAF